MFDCFSVLTIYLYVHKKQIICYIEQIILIILTKHLWLLTNWNRQLWHITYWSLKGEEEVSTSSRIQILETGDLLIAAVREKDAGVYTCVRSNEAGEVRGSANLSVLGKYTLQNNTIVLINSIYSSNSNRTAPSGY